MDKGDYSEVKKELITTTTNGNSNCAAVSPFDGDTVAFYTSAKESDSYPKGGHLRSFRKNGLTEGANRHELKSNNQRLSEPKADPSAWAMVHEVGHNLHFSDSATDMAFVTKNALALRDAHSNESKTAPFKSVHTPADPTPKQITKTFTNNTNNSNNGSIFSYKVKAEAAEPYDDDSMCEKDSTASFDFNRHRNGNSNVVGALVTKPTPSKWDDAEKWLSAGECAQAKARPKNSPALSRKEDGVSDDDGSPEKLLAGKFVSSSKKSLFPRFAFLPGSTKPVPLPLPVSVAGAPVDRYPLDDGYDGGVKESGDLGVDLKSGSRTAKPTAGAPTEAGDVEDASSAMELCDAAASEYATLDPPNMRTSVCMRDMGTEMTPMASMDPSRTATPLMATTPNLGSPAISRPASPSRTVRNTTPASGAKVHSVKPVGCPKALEAVGKAEKVVAALSGREKTRAEILALGTQLGKVNIAAWATQEEQDAAAAVKQQQQAAAGMEMEEVRKNLLACRALAWEEAEHAKYTARFKREEAKIQAWENHEKAMAEAEMRRVEVKVERMRSHANERLMNKLAATRRRAEDLRAKAEAVRCEKAAKTASQSDYIRRTGKMQPRSFLTKLCG